MLFGLKGGFYIMNENEQITYLLGKYMKQTDKEEKRMHDDEIRAD